MFRNPQFWSLVVPLALVSNSCAQDVGVQEKGALLSSSARVPSGLANEPEVSIAELIARALQNSPQLPIARENLEAARQRAAAARVLLTPSLEATPRILGNREAVEESLVVSQALDIFGKGRAQADVLAAQVRGAQADEMLADRSLRVQVKNAAVDLFAAQEAENLGLYQVEVARLFRDAAARRAQLGDVPEVQAQRAGLELLRAENELSTARAERLVRRAALNGIIGQLPETPLRVALPLSTDFDVALSTSTGSPVDFLRNSAPNNQSSPDPSTLVASSTIGADLSAQRSALLPGALTRPDIVRAQASLEAQDAQVRAVARGRYPDIALQVRRDTVFGVGGTALRAVVTVPLFDFGSLGREKRAAQAQVRASRAELELLRQQAATQVEQALIRLSQQRQTVETYRSGIVPQTLDLLRKTQIGYAQGASTYLEVLEAQRTLRAVQTEYLQALVGARTGEAALESALGAAPPAGLMGAIQNPSGAASPPGTAAPGTVPNGTIPPNSVPPLNPPSANLPGTSAPLEQGNSTPLTP